MLWRKEMDPKVIKAAIDSFENDDFLHAKELVQGQVRQARNDFIKSKLGLKNDIEKQFTELTPETKIDTTDPANPRGEEADPEPEIEPVDDMPVVKPKKRLLKKK